MLQNPGPSRLTYTTYPEVDPLLLLFYNLCPIHHQFHQGLQHQILPCLLRLLYLLDCKVKKNSESQWKIREHVNMSVRHTIKEAFILRQFMITFLRFILLFQC